MKRVAIGLLCAALVALSAVHPARAQYFGGSPIDGIHCDSMEGAVEHIHANVQLFDRGRALGIPAGIGIPVGMGCLYWLHTHTGDGFVHIESPIKRSFTLGQFFDIWGMELSRTRAGNLRASRGKRLSVWVNGKRYTGDPAKIVLRDHEEIVIQNGPPFARPRTPDWSKV